MSLRHSIACLELGFWLACNSKLCCLDALRALPGQPSRVSGPGLPKERSLARGPLRGLGVDRAAIQPLRGCASNLLFECEVQQLHWEPCLFNPRPSPRHDLQTSPASADARTAHLSLRILRKVPAGGAFRHGTAGSAGRALLFGRGHLGTSNHMQVSF